jgi:hypothetical protein
MMKDESINLPSQGFMMKEEKSTTMMSLKVPSPQHHAHQLKEILTHLKKLIGRCHSTMSKSLFLRR